MKLVLAASRIIEIFFFAAVTERAFIDQFFLLLSSGMVNHDVKACQIELKIEEAGSKTARKLKERRKSLKLLLRGKKKIMKNIRPV